MKLLSTLVSENKLLDVLHTLSLKEIKAILEDAEDEMEGIDTLMKLIYKKARELCEATGSSIDLKTFRDLQNIAIIDITKSSLLAEIVRSKETHLMVQSLNTLLSREEAIVKGLPSGDDSKGKDDLEEDMTRLGLKDVEDKKDESE